MNANFTKLISSAAAVLAVGGCAFAQTTPTKACPPSPSFEQGYGISSDKFPAAYNAASRIEVQNSWDIFATASFLYWYADQEGMDLAYSTGVTSATDPTTVTNPLKGSYNIMPFDFKPGFKVGLGMNFDFDNWVALVEYTWFHQKTTSYVSNPPTDARGGIPAWALTWFYYQINSITLVPNVALSGFPAKWRANFDIADATISRPYYQGRKLTVLPFGGLRGAFIRQNLNMTAKVLLPAADPTNSAAFSHNYSHSWAVGPRMGMQAHWLLGAGFRMEGDASGSVLFTRYNVSHRDNAGHIATNNTDTRVGIRYHEYNTLRPMADLKVGLGWGSYFDRQNYHFDLLASYEFNVMWGQNMMRQLFSSFEDSISYAATDLHLQGLTATARFDF